MEGDRHKRQKLDAAAWDSSKAFKKLTKWTIWLGMSAYLGLTFAGYYTPIRPLFAEILSGRIQSSTVLVVGFFTVVSLAFFGFFRGRFCSTMCPYARFQGAMFDRDTIMVNYDVSRGEPRGKAKDPDAGACVDCTMCVQVCPQNIDIRNGVQFECINCAACVDACDDIMLKLGRETGLVRYASEAEIEGDVTKVVRTRPILYGLAILAVATVFGLLLFHRLPLELDVVRDSGSGAFSQSADGRVMNQYSVRLTNKESPERAVQLSLDGFDKAELISPYNPVVLAPTTTEVVKVFVLVEQEQVKPVHTFRFVATDANDPNIQRTIETTFLRGGI